MAVDGVFCLIMENKSYRIGTKISDLAVEQGTGHDHALDLVGALVDLGDLSPAPLDLAVYRATPRYQRKYISIVLAGTHCYPTSDGLETA
jgi:hypothetical protein